MSMTKKMNDRLCCRLLVGSTGDIRQDGDGNFCWKLDDGLSKALVAITRETMTLTPAGAQFMLENLPPAGYGAAKQARAEVKALEILAAVGGNSW